MVFTFGDPTGDRLNARINLREIEKIATEWDHPYYFFQRTAEEAVKLGSDILQTSKKTRESYATAILAMALHSSTGEDWWMHIPEKEPPDGYIMMLKEEDYKGETVLRGKLREIEVVEHRDNDKTILERLTEKTDGGYSKDTVAICLVFVGGVYDFKAISDELKKQNSGLQHAFLVAHGMQLDGSNQLNPLKLSATQLLPEFATTSFDIRDIHKDFSEKFEVGREARSTKDGEVHYTTRNLKAVKD